LVAKLEHAGPAEPVPAFFLPDALEALISLGRLERAAAILERFEHSARRYDRAWALATAARCRGLLLAARGDLTGALAALDDALVANERIEMWFERARTLLVKGATERRARRRASARASLAEAASEFERIGARVWAERARDELDRVAGPSRRDADDLTPSQRRTVELAVDGLSNKEIAARLVVSVHTVEVHLSRAYAKLGVRSRTQLAGRLRAGV
jgi:ATP/maltotriose-dependent transcriptional regulator MalT